jgi:hypothetical protein
MKVTARSTFIAATSAVLLTLAPLARAQQPEELERARAFMGLVTDYMAIIEASYSISSSPEKAAIMQMQKIKEANEERGEKARTVEMLRKVLEESSNPTIRNAAYALLGDTLKESGRAAEAAQVLMQGLQENVDAVN